MNSEELKARTKQFALRVMIIEGELLPERRVSALLEEANALTAIFTAGVRTSQHGRDRR